MTTTQTLETLRTQAAAQVAQWPQYNAAYFAEYTETATVTRDVRTKMGLAFAKGDVVLVSRSLRDPDSDPRFVFAWSNRNAIATSIHLRDLDFPPKGSGTMFDDITVNMETGAISYPALPGFELDKDAVARTAALFASHCSPEMAVRHAIHGQLSAHMGAVGLFAMEGRGR